MYTSKQNYTIKTKSNRIQIEDIRYSIQFEITEFRLKTIECI